MACLRLYVVLSLLIVGVAFARPPQTSDNDYTGYKVLRISANGNQKFPNVIEMISRDFHVDIWSRNARVADVMVAPSIFGDIQRVLKSAGLTFKIQTDNVQSLLDTEYNRRQSRRMLYAQQEYPDIRTTYLKHDEINSFLTDVQHSATSAKVTLQIMGHSYEGRKVKFVKIQKKNENYASSRAVKKHAIMIDAGIHAREWITPAVAINVISKLALSDNDPEVNEMLDKFDWIIAPVVNPDGYDFSHERNERLWRKSRTDLYSNQVRCYGVDLNRNFGYGWNPDAGGSTNPCSDVFSGAAGFSEPETDNIRTWLAQYGDRTKLYLNLHSYGEYVLYPYGSDPNKFREEEELMIDVAKAFVDKMKALERRHYNLGNSAEVFYVAAGGADDYAKGGQGISLSYTPELTPSLHEESGWDGFIVPEADIAQVVDDTWEGLKEMARRVYQQYGDPGAE